MARWLEICNDEIKWAVMFRGFGNAGAMAVARKAALRRFHIEMDEMPQIAQGPALASVVQGDEATRGGEGGWICHEVFLDLSRSKYELYEDVVEVSDARVGAESPCCHGSEAVVDCVKEVHTHNIQ